MPKGYGVITDLGQSTRNRHTIRNECDQLSLSHLRDCDWTEARAPPKGKSDHSSMVGPCFASGPSVVRSPRSCTVTPFCGIPADVAAKCRDAEWLIFQGGGMRLALTLGLRTSSRRSCGGSTVPSSQVKFEFDLGPLGAARSQTKLSAPGEVGGRLSCPLSPLFSLSGFRIQGQYRQCGCMCL